MIESIEKAIKTEENLFDSVYKKEHYEEYAMNGKSKIFEEIIDRMMLDYFDEDFKNKIRNLPVDKKRMMILCLLDKDRNLFMKAKDKIQDNKPKLKHIKDLILILREYVHVGEVEKKKHGEVMTPLELVKEMLATLPEEVWTNPDLKWLDSCNGTGPFLAMVVYKLMMGLKEWQPDEEKRYKHILENMIYAGELQAKNMFLWLTLMDIYDEYNMNIYCGSFLDKGFDDHMKNVWKVDKFDVIVGNPPYQLGKNSNFYVNFIDKFEYIAKEKAFLLYITPNRFFQPSHKAHKSISKYKIHKLYHNLNEHFADVSTHIGAFLLSNEKSSNEKVDCVFIDSKSKINFNDPIPTDPAFSNVMYKNVINKIIQSEFNKLEFIKIKPKNGFYVKRQWKRWNSITQVGGDHVFQCLLNYNEIVDGKDGKWIETDDVNKMEWYLSKSNVIRFITKSFASAMNVPPFVWNIIPNIELDSINDNQDIYEYFKLSQEEIDLIENTIK